MNGQVTPSGMWLPGVGKHDGGKHQGGTYFDDELETAQDAFMKKAREMVRHLNERPDHVIFVGSTEEREQVRQVCNWWFSEGIIGHHPTIKIDYGVGEGALRIMEDRS